MHRSSLAACLRILLLCLIAPCLASAGQYLGFLAEDMAALGLDQLVIQGGPEQVPGVAYDRVAAALVLWLRDHEQRLAALEGAPL